MLGLGLQSNKLINNLVGVSIPIDNLTFYTPLLSDAVDDVGGLTPTSEINITYSDGANFNGTNSLLRYADNNVFSFSDGVSDSPFSVVVMLNIDVLKDFNFIFAKRDTGFLEYQGAISSAGNTQMNIFDGGGTNQIGGAGSLLFNGEAGNWIVWGWTYSGVKGAGCFTHYKNGELFSTPYFEVGTYVTTGNTASTFYLGTDRGTGNFYDGKMKHFSIWDKELTSGEMRAISSQLLAGNPLL